MNRGKFAIELTKARDYIYYGLLGGPKLLPMRYVINFFKCLTFLWILTLMNVYNNYSTGIYLYLFLHGSYGFAWCIKEVYFPDKSFQQKATLGSLTLLGIGLSLYWVLPWTIAAGYGIQEPSYNTIIFCIVLYLSGLFLMIGSDYQKFITLQKRKGLINSGFFYLSRNPNYLGQIMIYGSFAIASNYWVSYLIVVFFWSTIFATNMFLKDELSYKKKQGWKQYKEQSYILLPKLFPNDGANIVFYLGSTAFFQYII